MKLKTARQIVSGKLVHQKEETITEKKYEDLVRIHVGRAKNIINKAHKQERQRVRLNRRKSKAWLKRKAR